MSIPIPEPDQHYIAVKTEFMGDKIVSCDCGWTPPGAYYHKTRAEAAGTRHIKEQG